MKNLIYLLLALFCLNLNANVAWDYEQNTRQIAGQSTSSVEKVDASQIGIAVSEQSLAYCKNGIITAKAPINQDFSFGFSTFTKILFTGFKTRQTENKTIVDVYIKAEIVHSFTTTDTGDSKFIIKFEDGNIQFTVSNTYFFESTIELGVNQYVYAELNSKTASIISAQIEGDWKEQTICGSGPDLPCAQSLIDAVIGEDEIFDIPDLCQHIAGINDCCFLTGLCPDFMLDLRDPNDSRFYAKKIVIVQSNNQGLKSKIVAKNTNAILLQVKDPKSDRFYVKKLRYGKTEK